MKVVSYVYNTLSRFARSIKRDMAMYNLTVAMTFIPLGFVMFIYGLDKKDSTWYVWGALIIAIAILMWFNSMRLAKKEKKDEKDERTENLNSILKSFNTMSENIGKLVEEIKKDRIERNQTKGGESNAKKEG